MNQSPAQSGDLNQQTQNEQKLFGTWWCMHWCRSQGVSL